MTHILTGTALALTLLASPVLAGNTDTVQKFYDVLSNPGSESHANALVAVMAEDWESIGDYSGKNKTLDGVLGQIGGFGKLVPDLNWQVEAMHEAGDFVTVRSRATGTPAGPFFGVDGKGRSFDILAIDIHELEDGKIVRTHHVEDWAGALQQLSGK
ncbi:MAG: ester cyclase [Silicimonas sp.]|nr:ester cyclase [Silicimonas sp.]